MMQKLFSDVKSLLFLNGTIAADLLSSLPLHLPIIAADGAANTLMKLKVIPNYVVGDGDSFDGRLAEHAKIIRIQEQESTDFEKSIRFLEKEALTPALVLGMNGGEIDHILGNAMILLRQSPEVELYFLDRYEKEEARGTKFGILITKKKKVHLTLQPKSLVSILSFEKTVLTTHGLKWELDHALMDPKGLLSLRNETVLSEVDFEVSKGKALLIIDFRDEKNC